MTLAKRKSKPITLVMALAIPASAMLFTPVADADPPTNFCDAPTLCQADGPVVDVDWLREALASDADVQVIDIRSPEVFAAGHVPGSLSLDPAVLRATRDGVPGQIATTETIEAALRDAGVRAGARVVTIADQVSPDPARVVWTLHYLGHADVHLLQGGWTAWADAGAPVETGSAAAAPGDFRVDDPNPKLRVDADWVLQHLDDPTVTLVDVRSHAEYAAGHIPGARNIDWHDNVSGGALLGREQLEALYQAIPREHTVITYCSSGMRSSLTWLVLRALGYPDVRVYDGSWNEWGARDDLPKAT